MPESNAIKNMLPETLSAKVQKFETLIEHDYPFESVALKS